MSSGAGAPATDRARARTQFEQSLPFVLDGFQREAMDALDAGSSVVVSAPTGSGKTVVAEYAVAMALAEGKRAFYTAPIKALSNQKFRDLSERHGSANVGLLTGDTSINDNAPIVVMTTEVLRNMIHSSTDRGRLDRLRYVVMDEVHFLQDTYRGPVWEEVIISTPPEVDLVCLSATVSNAADLADWVSSVRGTTQAIMHTERPVELTQLFLIGHRNRPDVDVYETLQGGRPNPKVLRLDAERGGRDNGGFGRGGRGGGGHGRDKGRDRDRLVTPRRIDIVEMLRFEELLPAIYFIFSRAACDEAMGNCLRAGIRLTHPEERATIRQIVEAKVAGLTDADLDALDFWNFLAALENGIAAHHAGMVPPFKEAVEACFTEGLVKVVFATETLALGINMPARTVVIEKLTKFNGAANQMLTAGEYTQLTGRAGRRGLDAHGYAATLWSPFTTFEEVAELATRRTYELRSAFRPTYNLAANLIRRSTRERAEHFLKLSFAQYQIDAHLVRSNAAAERLKREIETARAQMVCERGDVQQYRISQGASGNRAARRAAERAAEITAAPAAPDQQAVMRVMSSSQPGTILRYQPLSATSDERHGVVVMSTSTKAGERVTVRALTIGGMALTITPDDVASVPEVVGHARVPVPYNPQSRHFQKQLTTNLNRELGPNGRRSGGRHRPPVADDAADPAALADGDATGVGSCPDVKKHLAAAAQIDRLEADLRRNQKVQQQRSNSLVDQFERVLALLDDVGCTDGWTLTDAGQTLAGVFHECDLLIADCVRAGLFDGLNPPQVAALASVFVFEARGSGRGNGDDLPRSFPKSIVDRWWRIADRAERLNDRESAYELPLTRNYRR
jgi:ATP-dependent RNA helicase HelY